MIFGLRHAQITIPEGSEDLARDFYCRLLGLPEVESPPLSPDAAGCGYRPVMGRCISARKMVWIALRRNPTSPTR